MARTGGRVALLGHRADRRSILARVWEMVSRGSTARGGREDPAGAARRLPTLFDLLDWLEVLELADDPFTVETFRRRLEYVMGVRIDLLTVRDALRGRVANPGAVYQILRSELVGRGGVSGGMVRDPVTEDAWVLTPGDLRAEEELKPPLHELLHVALGDPVPVPSADPSAGPSVGPSAESATTAPVEPVPPEARHKLRREVRADGTERLYWVPDSRLFPAPPLFEHEGCEQRAERLAEFALLASVYGGEALRDLDDDFFR